MILPNLDNFLKTFASNETLFSTTFTILLQELLNTVRISFSNQKNYFPKPIQSFKIIYVLFYQLAFLVFWLSWFFGFFGFWHEPVLALYNCCAFYRPLHFKKERDRDNIYPVTTGALNLWIHNVKKYGVLLHSFPNQPIVWPSQYRPSWISSQ